MFLLGKFCFRADTKKNDYLPKMIEKSSSASFTLATIAILGQPPGALSLSRFSALQGTSLQTTRKDYGFQTFHAAEIALYHTLGALPTNFSDEAELCIRFGVVITISFSRASIAPQVSRSSSIFLLDGDSS